MRARRSGVVANLGSISGVTCIEPGYFRTNLLTTSGEHKVTAQKQISPGDPVKGATVIVEILTKTGRREGRSLPGRLALGRSAMATIGGSLKREQEMMDTWKEIIISTDCDDVLFSGLRSGAT
ncbi:uncharacterized protein BDV17DRAFT_297193 [Aspergillus undulatus]|uniref:uncharacterized protein n=1 Tax=Aspergillus undulatus TaxID=1810928 RepID=UPI003CCD0CD8